jgi:hypothetical protein
MIFFLIQCLVDFSNNSVIKTRVLTLLLYFHSFRDLGPVWKCNFEIM